jgi:UDP:flavonoid glycosyltransferase YjiC (YdhE family)
MSSRATVSIVMLPEPGHLLPTLHLAAALRRRGHTVRYASLPRFERFFVDRGFEFQPILARLFPEKPGRALCDFGNALADLRRTALQGRPGDVPLDVPALLRPELTCRPVDLLMCDSLMNAARCEWLAHELQTPAVLLATQLGRGVAKSTLPELVLCPRELEIPEDGPALEGRYYAEPGVYRHRDRAPFPWHLLDRRKPMVLCSLGTQATDYVEAPKVLAAIVGAFDGWPAFQLVVASGGVEIPYAHVDPTVIVVRTVPQLALLSRASVLITHGGLGSVKEAILARVPMLLNPFTYDQPANARRVVAHQLGGMLAPTECSPGIVRARVDEVYTNAAVRVGVTRMGAIFRALEAEGPSVRLVARWLANEDRPRRRIAHPPTSVLA